ncbi:hypothetical protein L209DRAFT_103148 [Thermothelomyces heterothallicus CBS 203.75]
MAGDEDLLIRPLRDVVSIGKNAVASTTTLVPLQAPGSAGHADPIASAAHALLREGQRALNKVQSVWQDQASKYDDGVRDAIVRQSSIEKKRLHLEDLLRNFHGSTQLEEIDQARYVALRAATRALALDVVETANRLQLETTAPALPPGGFPPLPPLPPRPETRAGPGSRPPSAHSTRPRAPSKANTTHRGAGHPSLELSEPARQRPGVTRRLSSSSNEMSAKAMAAHRSQSSQHADACSPCQTNPHDSFTPPASPTADPEELQLGSLTSVTSERRRTFDSPPSPGITETSRSVMSTASISSSAVLASLDSVVLEEETNGPESAIMDESRASVPPLVSSSSSAESGRIGFDDMLRESGYNSDWRKSRPATPRAPDCTIREDSTYYKLKGLCRGATRFRKDGHWGSIKLTSEYDHGVTATGAGAGDMLRASDGITVPFRYEVTMVGACGDCGYAHSLDDIELDKGNKPEAVRTSESGARYRLRLLFKSHLRQRSSAETHYACLWCVQAGACTREGDATVFRSPDDLLRHLARHPQPLACIAGVSVCYGKLPDSAPLQFDLHLPETPIPVPMPENVAKLPTAIAVRDHYRRPGRGKLDKPPRYEADMLEFMEGARILGVIFPEKWGGKYCLGRHDGDFGAFPAKAIELRPPQETEIPAGGESGMSVTARWKWQPPETAGAPWLSFAKGEVITNVQCLYADYWCWSGTNSKGKTGVFPQCFIDLQTLRGQEPVAKKQSRGRSFFGSRTKGNSASKSNTAGRSESAAS